MVRLGKRGKFLSWSTKGVRVGYGRHKKQVVKTGCCVVLLVPLGLMVLLVLAAWAAEASSVEGEGPLSEAMTYLGKERSPQWVRREYERFKDFVFVSDGKARVCPGALFLRRSVSLSGFWKAQWDAATPQPEKVRVGLGDPKGTVGLLHESRVFQVIDGESMLIESQTWRQETSIAGAGYGRVSASYSGGRQITRWVPGADRICFVSGLSTGGLVDRQGFPSDMFVVAGTYSYKGTDGATHTVTSLTALHPCSQGQFLMLLHEDVEIEAWLPKDQTCKACRGTGKSMDRSDTRRMIRDGRRERFPCDQCGGRGKVTVYTREALR